ncbi:MAG: RIP metalloprotease RseP [Bacteroidales bacterium]|nr:RIP metalloprotease RseP [Bacteroidales bacterium]
MGILLQIIQVIIALSILILVHEAGHFCFSKIFGIRVDKFFLFFDAGGIKLLSTKSGWFSRLFPKMKDWDTEYGIGWLPLGGYCKISGMIDESMDTEHLGKEPQEWEFRSKPAWQRLLVMSGGVLFNFLLAAVLYTAVLAGWGESYISNEGSRIYVNDLAYDMGFRNGDHIISLDGHEPENFHMLQAEMARQMTEKATVLRKGDTLDIYLDHNRIGEILNSPGMFSLAIPFCVSSIDEDSPNADSILKEGDTIIGIEGTEVEFVQDAWPILKRMAGETVSVNIIHEADTLETALQVDTAGRLGIFLRQPEIRTKEYNVLTAIPAGIKKTFDSIGGYAKDLKLVATPKTEAYKSVGSFIAIGQVFPKVWDWPAFISICAMLSIMLGVMNLIPIPALDGGHIVFTLYEMLTGRKPSDKFLMVMQALGMLLLMALIFLAFGNDIGRLLR